MKYTRIPHTDIRISKICLGTMTFGRQNSEEQGHEQMDYALEQGINFFDTAELYPITAKKELYAVTEEIIGTWFKKTGNRDKVVLATKIAGRAEFTKHIRTTGFTKDSLIGAVDGSLKRLQTDYIDLYQLHWPERNTNYFGKRGYDSHAVDLWEDNIHQVLETLRDLVSEGKIRHVGLSNETPWGTMRFLEEGFGVLSGKYLDEIQTRKGRLTLFPGYTRYSGDNSVTATRRYQELAQTHGLTLAQMALAFVNTRPFLTSNIIVATTLD